MFYSTPGNLPDSGIEPVPLRLLHWRADSLPLKPPGKPTERQYMSTKLLLKSEGKIKTLHSLKKLLRDSQTKINLEGAR